MTKLTKQQRQQRAVIFCEQPYLWLFVFYAICFFCSAVICDVLSLAGDAAPDGGLRYLLPLVIAWSLWRLFRRSAQQTIAALESGKKFQEDLVEIERQSSCAIKKAPDAFSDKL